MEDRADVEQREAAAIVKIDVRMREAGDVSAEIQLRVGQMQNEFVQLDSIRMKRKPSCQIESERHIAFRGEPDVMEIDDAQVNAGCCGFGRVMKSEVEVTTVRSERDTQVADLRAAVAQLKCGDLQIEQGLLPGLAFGARLARRQVAAPVLVDGNSQLGTVDRQFVERKFAMEE